MGIKKKHFQGSLLNNQDSMNSTSVFFTTDPLGPLKKSKTWTAQALIDINGGALPGRSFQPINSQPYTLLGCPWYLVSGLGLQPLYK